MRAVQRQRDRGLPRHVERAQERAEADRRAPGRRCPTGRGSSDSAGCQQDRARGARSRARSARSACRPSVAACTDSGRDRRGERLARSGLHQLRDRAVRRSARRSARPARGTSPRRRASSAPGTPGPAQSGAHSSTSCPSDCEQPGRMVGRRDALRLDLLPARRGRAQADPQRMRRQHRGLGERRVRQRRAERRRRPVTGQQVERERGVEHRAGEHAVDAEALEGGQLRPERDPEPGRLEPDDAAARRGDADRAAGVVAVRDRDQAGGDRGGAAARRAAR